MSDGGQRFATVLADRNVDGEPVMWNDTSVDRTSYDAVLIRSYWDYL